jgi:hypothetical protein
MGANDIGPIGHRRLLPDQGLEPLMFQHAFDRPDPVWPLGVALRRFMMNEAGMRNE